MSEAYLILENGTVFKGRPFGYEAETIGELIFTTGMTGYMEALTDPRYFGQIVLQTFPLIGNYGVIPAEQRSSDIHLKAYIVREWCQEPSNFRSEGSLDNFLRINRVPGIFDIDTRAVTRILRENGTMNAMISNRSTLSDEQWEKLREYKITGAIGACSEKATGSAAGRHAGAVAAVTQGDATQGTQGDGFLVSQHKRTVPLCQTVPPCPSIAVWDFGDTGRLIRSLGDAGCELSIFGHGIPPDRLLAENPDGIVLSGGPGDPAENTRIIEEIYKLCGSGIPIFGVGLGHQMLALARGAKTEKLKFGHHGSNQTVAEPVTRKVFVTSQNHGYAVMPDSIPDGAVMSYANANDGTCEGIDYTDIPAMSVQFEPTDNIIAKFLASITQG